MQNLASPTTAPVTGGVFVRSYAGLIDMAWSGQANLFATSTRLAMLEVGRHPSTAGRGAERLLRQPG